MKHVPQDIRKMETRKKLLDAAVSLFSTKGYYQSNSREIAKLAGVSVGSFYTYFNDKKSLLKELLNDYIESIISDELFFNSSSDDSPLDYERFIRNIISMHKFTEGFFTQVTLLSNTDTEIEIIYTNFINTILKQIQSFMINKCHHLSDEDAQAISLIMYSALEGVTHTIKFKKINTNEDVLIHQLVLMFRFYIESN